MARRAICSATFKVAVTLPPQVIYAFDAKTTDELEAKLKDNLTAELREIRRLSTV